MSIHFGRHAASPNLLRLPIRLASHCRFYFAINVGSLVAALVVVPIQESRVRRAPCRVQTGRGCKAGRAACPMHLHS
jgi:hypothetical protein